MDQHQLDIVQAHPLGAHLDPSRTSLSAIVQDPVELDTVNREDLQPIVLVLFSTFLNHPASRLLSSPTNQSNLSSDILRAISAIASNTIHFDQIKPLLNAVLHHQPDVEIWEQVYHAVILQTPRRLTTSSIVNSSEKRDQMDKALSDELGAMYIDILDFYEAFFSNISKLETVS